MTTTPHLDLPSLFRTFAPQADLPQLTHVNATEVPEPYHRLLVHTDHMTVTVEAFYAQPVAVRVLARHTAGERYTRKILLALERTGQIVQFGIVRIGLNFCPPVVREEILAEREPLGRILITHDLLRRIELTGFVRVAPGPDMRQWFGPETNHHTYGRLGYIHVGDQPAIELVEILAPIPPAMLTASRESASRFTESSESAGRS